LCAERTSCLLTRKPPSRYTTGFTRNNQGRQQQAGHEWLNLDKSNDIRFFFIQISVNLEHQGLESK
jgi:hypothetical protein